MAAGPTKATEQVHRVLSVVAPPRATRQVLLEIIIGEGWAFGTDAEDKADLWLIRFKRRLNFIIEESSKDGDYRCFAFNSSGDDFIQGYCFAEPTDIPEVVDAKRKRANTVRIFEHIARIGHQDFELLSGKLLELLRVEKAYVSRRSADQESIFSEGFTLAIS